MFKKAVGCFLMVLFLFSARLFCEESSRKDRGLIVGTIYGKGMDGEKVSLYSERKSVGTVTANLTLFYKGKKVGGESARWDKSIFNLDNLEPGNYDLMIVPMGYTGYKPSYIQNIAVKGGEPAILDLVLSEKGEGWQTSANAVSIIVSQSVLEEKIASLQNEIIELKKLVEKLLERKN